MAAKKKATTVRAPTDPLLDAIESSPDDDAARLVYADSLIEKGDPRGELIQLQCALGQTDEDNPDPRLHRMKHRERALLAAHGNEWLKDLRAIGEHLEFELVRGFPERVRGPANELGALAAKIVAAAPLVRHIEGHVYQRSLAPLIESSLFARATTVKISSGKRRADLTALTALKGPLPLRRLELDEVSVGREDVDAIAKCEALGELRELDFNRCLFGKDSPRALESLAAPLTLFNAQSGKYPEGFVHALTTSQAFEHLQMLGLCNVAIGDEGLATLIAAGRLESLEDVDLRSCGLSTKGVMKLLDALPSKGVRRLLLGGNALDDAIAARIAKWPGATALRKLDLGGLGAAKKLGDRGARALADSPHLGALRSLVLSGIAVDAKTETKLLAGLPKARLYVGDRFLKRAP